MRIRLIPFVALALTACSVGGGPIGKPANIYGVPQRTASIYTDDVSNLSVFKKNVAEAKQVSSAFFGRPAADPAYVFCDTEKCDRRFSLRTVKGAGPRAKTVGDQLIVIGTRGRDQVIITHEQVHADLHSLFSLVDVIRGRVPAWFDEGLAGYVAKDKRLFDYPNLAEAEFVMEAVTARQFMAITNASSWHRVYGAGTALVGDMDQKLGRAGLLAFIDTVAQSGDFDAELKRVMGPGWPRQ
jgi:hypothetical protein